MAAPTFTQTDPPGAPFSRTPIDVSGLARVRGGGPATPSLTRDGVTFTPIDVSSITWRAAPTFDYGDIPDLGVLFGPADAASITLATGVAQMNDKSGNANHAVQAVGAAQPTLTAAAQNGLSALKFTSSSSQYMSLTTPIDVSGGYTLFTVAARNDGTFGSIVEVFGRSLASGLGTIEWWNDALIYGYDKDVWAAFDYKPETGYHLLAIRVDMAGTIDFWFDGVKLTRGSQGGAADVPTIGVLGRAGGGFANCHLGDVALWTRVLTDEEITQVTNFALTKWGIV